MRINIDHPTNKANFSVIRIGVLGIAFSYSTPIGYTPDNGFTWIVRVNDWGPTTDKHLNELDFGKKAGRLEGTYFEASLAEAIRMAHS